MVNIMKVSLFPAVHDNIHLHGHKGNGASKAFPADTLSLDFIFTMYDLVSAGFKIQSIKNQVLFGQQAFRHRRNRRRRSSHPVPNESRVNLHLTKSH